MSRRVGVWSLWAFCLCLLACEPSSSKFGDRQQVRQRVVYGVDDRVDVRDHPDAMLRQLAQSVGVFVSTSRISYDRDTRTYTLSNRKLTDKIQASDNYGMLPLCAAEKFRTEPAPGSCTVVLIGPRRVATAGHCIRSEVQVSPQSAQLRCNARRVVFGFQRDANGQIPLEIPEDNVYACERVLLHRYDRNPSGVDVAVIELDRDVKGFQPIPFVSSPGLQQGDAVAVIGNPHGIATKIASGNAAVFEPRSTTMDYFTHTIDVNPGNSGAPVFSLASYGLVGLHVRSPRPVYETSSDGTCVVSRTLPDSESDKLASAAYARHLNFAPCQSDADCPSTRACENAECTLRFQDVAAQDLSLSSATATRLGESITVRFKVVNVGTATISSPFRVGVWRSSNSTISPGAGQDTELASREINRLEAGQALEVSFSIQVTADFSEGAQFLGVYVDDAETEGGMWSPDNSGEVSEITASNNRVALEFTYQPCANTCPVAGDVRCQGQDVQTCVAQPDGCLAWQTEKTCTASQSCEAGRCQDVCSDQCTQDGALRCDSDATQRCEKGPQGCLNWSASTPCAAEEMCEDGQCKPRPTRAAVGASCEKGEDCQSERCEAPPGSAKRCTSACRADTDCASVGALSRCLPQGFCWEPAPPSERPSTCPSEQQLTDAGTCAPLSPPGGCQCSASTRPPWEGLITLWVLLLLWRRRRYRIDRCVSPSE